MNQLFKYSVIAFLLGASYCVCAQNNVTPHYTMFMYNKLIYNPAYAGSRDATCINTLYRSQWVGIDGAPRNYSISIDGPVGSYMKPFRPVALGLSVSNESAGVINNTNIMAYYAYRIPVRKSLLSFGLQAGTSMLNARFSQLNPYEQGDYVLTNDLSNRMLPNFGAGVYWRGENYYLGASVPNLLENYFDRNNKINDKSARQIRAYYLSGGYVFTLSDILKLEPQALFRYAGNNHFNLPASADFNLSVILYDRLMLGATCRTDRSFAAVVHLQVTQYVNAGYSYDYATRVLNGFNGGSHEVTLGFDLVKDKNKYINPRFVKLF